MGACPGRLLEEPHVPELHPKMGPEAACLPGGEVLSRGGCLPCPALSRLGPQYSPVPYHYLPGESLAFPHRVVLDPPRLAL